MLCPEVWKFSPPDVNFKTTIGSLHNKQSKQNVFQTIESHYFNHMISLVFPDTGAHNFPPAINECFTIDSDYYKIEDIRVEEFINIYFIEGFINKGRLYVLSINTQIDTDDCLAITPCGKLILSLQKESYQELGLEGKLSHFCQKEQNRYVVHVDLKSDIFKPGKKNYDRVKWCLTENFKPLNVILSWLPNDKSICPSSIASYLNSLNYKVLLCETKTVSRMDYTVEVPLFDNTDVKSCDLSNLIEWIGIHSINADLGMENYDYLSSYEVPEENTTFGQVTHVRSTGLYTPERIRKILDEIRVYLSTRPHLPWISLHVQGFSDSPVSWKLKEHQYYINGDNCYTIILRPDEQFAMQTVLSSNKRPK